MEKSLIERMLDGEVSNVEVRSDTEKVFTFDAIKKDLKTRMLETYGPCRFCGAYSKLRALFKKDGRHRLYRNLWNQKETIVKVVLPRDYNIVCANCFSKGLARALLKPKFEHGTVKGYKYYKCRCEECKQANRGYAKSNKAFRFDPRRPLSGRGKG